MRHRLLLPFLLTGLLLAPPRAPAAMNASEIYGQVQGEPGGWTAKIFVGRADRPLMDGRTTPVLMDVEEAVVRIDLGVATEADRPATLTVVFGEGEEETRFEARYRLAPSEEFDVYPAPEGHVFEARVPVSAVYEAPGRTWNTTYAIFRTTDNDDTLTFKKGLTSQPGPPFKLPHQELAFVDNSESVEFDMDEDGFPVCRDLHGAGGCETFNAGAVAQVPFRVLAPDGSDLATAAILVEQVPDWIYFSGHYPRSSGGSLDGASIHPEQIPGTSWKGELEVLIFAACYAVEINTPKAQGFFSGAGIDGARWWDKFKGTLLGYRHLAPSSAASRVTENFLARVKKISVSPETDSKTWSQRVAEAWMAGNTKDGVAATNAAAVDASGRYHFVNNAEISLAGALYRDELGWHVIEEEKWRGHYQATLQARQRGMVIGDCYDLIFTESFPPPTYHEVVQSDTYRDAAARHGVPYDDAELLEEIRENVEQRRREFYEGGDEWVWETVAWAKAEELGGTRPPTVEEVQAVFRTDDPELVPVILPAETVEQHIFQEWAGRVWNDGFDEDTWERTMPFEEFLQKALAPFPDAGRRAERERYLRELYSDQEDE